VLYPRYFIGRNPQKQLIAASHTEDLASQFGRRVRNLFGAAEWPFQVELATDSQAAGQWSTVSGGGYYAVGVGGAVHGRRADGIIIDDPMKGRADADSKIKREAVWQWYKTDLRTRLKPLGFVILIMTRWHTDDLAGRLLPKNYNGATGWVTSTEGEQWYVVNLPALAEKGDPLGREPGEPLWPDWWTLKMLEDERRAQTSRNWAALYQQRPVLEEGGIFKEKWWQLWEDDHVPKCDIRLMSVDTAYTDKTQGDYSAVTIWGRFRDDKQQINLILLYAWKGQLETPDLIPELEKMARKHRPTRILIENKAAGLPVLQELRRRLPDWSITAFEPSRYGEKIARAYAVQGVLESKIVWVPDRKFAEMVVDECSAFPHGEHDDLVDTVSQAFLHLRTAGVITRPDEVDEELLRAMDPKRTQKRALYGHALQGGE
jgi:predicted phage terminase large subunit-like protein